MRRSAPVLAALLVLGRLAGPAIAQAPLKARFIGNAAFEITDGSTTLLTDFPYKSGAFGYMTYRFESVQPQGDVLCLITHAHQDHWLASLLPPDRWSVAGPSSVTDGVPVARVVPVFPRGKFKNVIIQAIATPHEPKGHYSYLVVWNGQRLYFTGDTEVHDALMATSNIDTLFITPWLVRNAQKLSLKLPARRIVIYHHDADEPLPTCENCVGPRQGEVLTLSAGPVRR